YSKDRARGQELAAWAFLVEVRELFPERWAKLQASADAYEEEVERKALDVDDDDPFLRDGVPAGPVYNGLYRLVRQWTCKNNISCPAIDAVAALIVARQDPDQGLVYVGHHDERGNWIPLDNPHPIQAWRKETLEEFIERARQHYNEM